MRWKLALILLGLMNLPGCAPSGPVPDTFCKIGKPIWLDWADKLTPQTEKAVIAHNEKGAELCGWK